MTSRLRCRRGELRGTDRTHRALVGKAEAIDSGYRTVLDMDSTENPVYGEQEQSPYNGHIESTCYHPLLLFNREGVCLAAKLRPGNVHSAEGWEELLLPEIERQQKLGKEVVLPRRRGLCQAGAMRGAGRAGCKVCEPHSRDGSLERDIVELLTQPAGRRSQKPVVEYKGVSLPGGQLEDRSAPQVIRQHAQPKPHCPSSPAAAAGWSTTNRGSFRAMLCKIAALPFPAG
jgi:hypothetical protein